MFEFSCVAQKSGKTHSEDLSEYRPKFTLVADTLRKNTDTTASVSTIPPTRNVNEKVDAVLDSIDKFNLTKRFVDGFTLQIYSGQKREEAMEAKQKLMNYSSDLVGNLKYVQPKFRVTIGKYFSKLEAQKDLMHLKRVFPNVILVPEKIQIR